MEEMIKIDSPARYRTTYTSSEFHTHKPYASSTFKNNDEIRIPISQQDIITVPSDSSLYIKGTVKATKTGGATAKVSLVNNAMAFLFEDIRYEIGGIEVDRVKNCGITTTIKNILSTRKDDEHVLKNACWLGPANTMDDVKEFTFSVPLKLLFGFMEDYDKLVMNVKQELILLRSASDINVVVASATEAVANVEVTITDLYWRVPHLTVTDTLRLHFLKLIDKDTPIDLAFRNWELHEFPALPETQRQSWTIKTSSQLEKPRYVVLAFQTDRKNKLTANMSQFDHCKLMDVKLYLNSQYFPYDNVRGDFCLFYDMFVRFQKSYYNATEHTTVDLATFKNKCPMYLLDCSKQNDLLKTGSVDVRLEFEASENFPANTTAYCLLIHDAHLIYTLLTGSVRRVM